MRDPEIKKIVIPKILSKYYFSIERKNTYN